MVAIDLTPAFRVRRIVIPDVARLRLEARMTVAEVRGRRIVVIAAPQPPATL